jgi:uncharacterized protein YkwD
MAIAALSRPRAYLSLAFSLAAIGVLAGCIGAPTVQQSSGALSPGLVASMDRPGAQMDRQTALGIINQYRATRGIAPLAADPALDQQAQSMASQYAQSGTPPRSPDGHEMRLSAGYSNFAETFSGWRNSPADADILASSIMRRAGLAVVYNENSNYGTHWVLLMGQ